jgi:hypothetical protein
MEAGISDHVWTLEEIVGLLASLIDAEMDLYCKKVLQLVSEAERVKGDRKAIVEKLKELRVEIQKMKAITARARS